MPKSGYAIAAAVLGVMATGAPRAFAIIFNSTGDPNFNTTAPTSTLAGSGWQWEGNWHGWYSGTVVAPQYFIAAAHTGGTVAQDKFTLNDVEYPTVAFPDGSPSKTVPGTDLRLWKISGTFASYAPLYDTTDEVGKTFVMFGRGGQRGAEVRVPAGTGTLKGWRTPESTDPGFDLVRRWGQNKVVTTAGFATAGDNQELVYYFDASGSGNVGVNEATVSLGDSGGGVFIQTTVGQWKLAALNYGAAGPFSYTAAADPQTDPKFKAALFDRTGLFDWSSGAAAANTGPAYAFASRIAPNLASINGLMAAGGSPVWNTNASGNWGTGSNWWNGTAPSGTSSEAVLGSIITAQRTVTMDAAKTVGTLTIDSAISYVIGGSNTLTVQGAAGTGVIRAYVGSHTISAPLTLVGNTQISLAPLIDGRPNPTLTISGTLNANGGTIQKQGPGTLIVNNIRNSGLEVQAGKVRIATNGGNAGVSHLTSLSISAGATLDLNDNDLVVDYSGGSPFGTIQNLVLNGYAPGPDSTKTGIVSTTSQNTGGNTILALFDNALAGFGQWPTGSGMTVPANSVIGKYTYLGDTNMDGQVTPQDYTAVDSNLGTTGLDPGIAWFYGDTDFNGSVTPQDYTAIDSSLGMGVGQPLTVASLSVAAVPEISSAGAVVAVGLSLLGKRRRKAY
jgi:hypothetical protein